MPLGIYFFAYFTSIVFKDKRGEIIDVFQNIKFEHSAIITFNKNAVRANHFHKKSIQYSLILSGKFIAKEVKIPIVIIENIPAKIDCLILPINLIRYYFFQCFKR